MQLQTNLAANARRKAVLIGINYHAYPDGFKLEATDKTYHPIFGSHIDVGAMKAFLMGHQAWPEESIIVMTDDPNTPPHLQPTRANILHQLKELAIEARSGDSLFLQFSGHGDQIPDEDFDEVDGLDEIIIASDAQLITDDELHETLVRKIPTGCHMSVVFDCCSSGTALDLPIFPDNSIFVDTPTTMTGFGFGFTDSPQSTEPSPQSLPSPTGVLRAARDFYQPFSEEPRPLSPLSPTGESSDSSGPRRPIPPNLRTTPGPRPAVRKKYSSGDVVMWSACRDHESSGEVTLWSDPRSRGAMTHAFIESMTSNEYKAQPTYHNLLNCIRHRINSYSLPLPQHVQLSSSSEIDPEKDYIL